MAERRKGGRDRNGLSGREAIARVRRDLPQLLGRPIESVLGVQREDDDGWMVTVQVVELSRIPSTTDVLASYEVTLDQEGELLGYRRGRRYYRNQTDQS
jgi:Gas vesicle synthesis protein GvpO